MYKQTKTRKQWNAFFHTETNTSKPYTSYAIVGCGGINPYSFRSGLCLDLLRLENGRP